MGGRALSRWPPTRLSFFLLENGIRKDRDIRKKKEKKSRFCFTTPFCAYKMGGKKLNDYAVWNILDHFIFW